MNPRVVMAAWLLSIAAATSGCYSPLYTDRGALFGGLTGAGLGALVGDSVGDAAAGAAIGAGVGALTGAAVGEALDEIDARNRAEIAAQLGRPVQAGATSIDEVVAMSDSGVADQLIISHIRNNGVAGPLSAADVIHLHKQGVSTEVIQAMQSPPPRPVSIRRPGAPEPLIIEEHYYGPPPHRLYRPQRYRRHYHAPGPSWGFSFSS